jgi:hypothetical protein
MTPADIARIRRRATYPLRPIHLSDLHALVEEVLRLQKELQGKQGDTSG